MKNRIYSQNLYEIGFADAGVHSGRKSPKKLSTAANRHCPSATTTYILYIILFILNYQLSVYIAMYVVGTVVLI